MRIGIDVGGTNTDAVLVDADRVVFSVKTATTPDVTSGITNALANILSSSKIPPVRIQAVMIGTTHFTNAVAQRRDLNKVAAVRVCLPASASLEPFIDWPDDLREKVKGENYLLQGGHEYDGRPIAEFEEDAMRKVACRIRESGWYAVGITSVFSPLTSVLEERAAKILLEEHPEASVTLSHDIGRIGLLERENATLLNASLQTLAKRTTHAFTRAIEDCGIKAQLYLTQNDGTVMLADMAEKFPVFSFASGPTNSMRGAAFLSKILDAIVVDVGGTTTDIGMLKHGFPREANTVVKVGGVRTLFRMPDLLSLALGGGTLVHGTDFPRIGPESTGYELTKRSVIFGGPELTCTDVAVARGLAELGDPTRLGRFDRDWLDRALSSIHEMIEDGIDRIKTEAANIPVIAVGGANFLIPRSMTGVSEVIRIEYGDVANAVGAAIAQISGECDQIFRDLPRDEAINQARKLADQRAITAGANPDTLKLIEVEDLPLAYMPGNALRVRVRVVGDIAKDVYSPEPSEGG